MKRVNPGHCPMHDESFTDPSLVKLGYDEVFIKHLTKKAKEKLCLCIYKQRPTNRHMIDLARKKHTCYGKPSGCYLESCKACKNRPITRDVPPPFVAKLLPVHTCEAVVPYGYTPRKCRACTARSKKIREAALPTYPPHTPTQREYDAVMNRVSA